MSSPHRTIRIMDEAETGNANNLPRQQLVERLSWSGAGGDEHPSQVLLALILFLMFGFLPLSSLLFWVIIGAFILSGFARMRRFERQMRQLAEESSHHATTQRLGTGRARGALFSRQPFGSATVVINGSHMPISATNLRLSMINRNFTAADYELLIRLDEDQGHTGPPVPVPEEQLAALPVETYMPCHPERDSTAAAGSGWAEDDELVCTVCLDSVPPGAQVLTLPCKHQFHKDCILPWLRQQGAGCTCPVCKATVFPELATQPQ